MILIFTIGFSVPLVLFGEKLFCSHGGNRDNKFSHSIWKDYLAGTIFIFFTNMSNAILRAEGDVKRAMYAITFGSVLNYDFRYHFYLHHGDSRCRCCLDTILSLGVSTIININ